MTITLKNNFENRINKYHFFFHILKKNVPELPNVLLAINYLINFVSIFF